MLQVGVPLQSPEQGTEVAKGIQTHPGVSAAQPPGVLATLSAPTQALTSARASFLVTSGAPRPHPWSLPGLMPSTHTSEHQWGVHSPAPHRLLTGDQLPHSPTGLPHRVVVRITRARGYLLHQCELLLLLLLLSLAPGVQIPPGPWGQGTLSLHGAAGTSQASSRGRRA